MFGYNFSGTVDVKKYDRVFFENATIREVLCFFPRRCYHSNRTLWFKKAYKAETTMYMLPNRYPKIITRWFDKDELAMIKLQDDYQKHHDEV